MSNNQTAEATTSELWKLITRASTGQMTEAVVVAKLKKLLLESAPAQEPWGWIAHCAKSGGEPIIVTETIAKELSKFDDWDVFQVARLPQSGALPSVTTCEVPVADKTEQRVSKACDQPQAHPARCGCELVPVQPGSFHANADTARIVFTSVTDKQCDQPQAHPARCGCSRPKLPVPRLETALESAIKLLERVQAFDRASRLGDGYPMGLLMTHIQQFMQEQGQ
jgi:hypothetical protein